MIALWMLGFTLAGVWLWRKRRRAVELAGRMAEKPTYQVEPPRRTLGSRRTELL